LASREAMVEGSGMSKPGVVRVLGWRLTASLAPMFVVACVQVGTGGGGVPGEDGGSAGEGGAADGGLSGSDASGGTNCTVQTTSGTMLCEGLGRCPSVTVDQNAFTQCGFTQSGAAAIFECECSGYLCSGGMAATCSGAAALLVGQTSVEICNQLSAGGCVFEAFSTGGSGAGSSTCNTACESTCVGDTACIQGCGC
jgi:hypothetical protein